MSMSNENATFWGEGFKDARLSMCIACRGWGLKTILALSITTLCCKTVGHSDILPMKIESMTVYLDFHVRGYTNGAAYSHFDEMQRLNTEAVTVSNKDLERVSSILEKAMPHKLRYGLFGVNNSFCLLHIGELQCKTVIGESDSGYYFVDFTRKMEYQVSSLEDVNWIRTFIEGFRTKDQ